MAPILALARKWIKTTDTCSRPVTGDSPTWPGSGLREEDIYQGTNRKVLGYLFDQYVRACEFTPTGTSWVFIVKPSGARIPPART